MARSDFTWVDFDEELNTGSPAATCTFNVEGNPTSIGFLLIQYFDAENNDHQISINDRDLPNFDIPANKNATEQWFTWMDRIPPGFLHQGENRITIRRTSTEKIGVANVAIHWRKAG